MNLRKLVEEWLISRAAVFYRQFPINQERIEIPASGKPELVCFRLQVVWTPWPRVVVDRKRIKQLSQKVLFSVMNESVVGDSLRKAYRGFATEMPNMLAAASGASIVTAIEQKLEQAPQLANSAYFCGEARQLEVVTKSSQSLLQRAVDEACSMLKVEMLAQTSQLAAAIVSEQLSSDLANIRNQFFGSVAEFEGLGKRKVLPEGCRFFYSRGSSCVVVVQQPPDIHTIGWVNAYKNDYSRSRDGSHAKHYTLAFPYVIFAIRFKDGRYQQMNVALSTKPVVSLEQQLIKFNLSNVSSDNKVCLGITPQGETVAEVTYQAIGKFWANNFNRDWSDNMYYPNLTAHTKCSGFEQWENATKRDPNFVLNVPWQSGPTLQRLLVSACGEDSTTLLETGKAKDTAAFDQLAKQIKQNIENAISKDLAKKLGGKVVTTGKYRKTIKDALSAEMETVVAALWAQTKKHVVAKLGRSLADNELQQTAVLFQQSFASQLNLAYQDAITKMGDEEFAPLKPHLVLTDGSAERKKLLTAPLFDAAQKQGVRS